MIDTGRTGDTGTTDTVARLPGFRDFAPEQLAVRARIFDAWRRVARRYGFEEYDGPPLEALDLYVRKSGEEIVGQLYRFEDQGGREVALRPEMTPSLARILAERSRALPKPIRWFSVPQLFRYERQQRGRLREHFQWNVDVIGEEGVGADAEVLAVALDGVRELGLTADDVVARVSDRRLLSALLASLGVPGDRALDVFQVVDKLERQGVDRSRARLVDEVALAPATAEAVLELFEATELDWIEDRHGADDAVAARVRDLRDYFARLGALGLGSMVSFDLSIVRGLAYYTGIVFELFDRERSMRAICGGGRYDRLLEALGGEPLAAVGFGMGDVVLGDLLADRSLLPEYQRDLDLFLVTAGDQDPSVALEIAAAQRRQGRSVGYALSGASVRKQFKAASASGARSVIVLGPDEVREGVATLRDMETGSESSVALETLR